MVSMKEIAAICQVSVGTVSKALANQPGVSSETGERIRGVASRLRYRPNALVRSIQNGRSMSVAVACNAVEDPWGGMVLRGVLAGLCEAGYEALLLQWDWQVRSGEHMLRSMGERRVDGVIMFPPATPPTPAYLHELRTFPGPVIVLDQQWSRQEFHFVGTDDRLGTLAAVAHLRELGHTAIGCLHAPEVSTGVVRLQAVLEAMRRAGLAVRDHWLAPAATFADALAAASRLLTQADRPTALLCFNDEVAWGALNAALDLGLRVPADLALVGFADLPLAVQVRPPLTTVRQPKEELGRQGVRLLLERIAEGERQGLPLTPAQVLLPTELVVRHSTGPAPQR
jgi:LacI family transcriptional regulator